MGSLYSSRGLRFGGFQTAEFLEVTDDIEELRPGVREEIIAEAHYLVYWLHRFPEIAFFFGTLFSLSLLVGSICFVGAFLLETFRFHTFGASPFVSRLCWLWGWIKIPLFIGASILLWPEVKPISIVFVIFLILQGWLGIISAVVMLPIRMLIATLLVSSYKNARLSNMEGLTMQYIIYRWRMKLLPPEEVHKFDMGTDFARNKEKIQSIDRDLQELIDKGRDKGFLTYDEINSVFPGDIYLDERLKNLLDNLLETLAELGVDVLEE